MSDTATSPKSLTDWERVDALRDEDIDLSDSPEITPEMFARAELRHRGEPVARREKAPVYVDSDILTWFKAQGEGFDARQNGPTSARLNRPTLGSDVVIVIRESLLGDLSRIRSGGTGLDMRTKLSETTFMTGADFIRRVRKLGRVRGILVEVRVERGKGSHRHLYFGERFTVVRAPKSELKKGTLHAMLKQIGLKLNELIA